MKVKVLSAPPAGGSVGVPWVGTNGCGDDVQPKVVNGDSSGNELPLNAANEVCVLASPQMSGLASGAKAPPLKCSAALLSGACGFR